MDETATNALEMNFCRRCGAPLTSKGGHVYQCEQGHLLFANASPAAGIILLNDANEVLMLQRAREPKKGMLGIPGGFCDGAEDPVGCIARELQEEVGLSLAHCTTPEFMLAEPDDYMYKEEKIPVLDLVYTARLLPGAAPQPNDGEVAAVRFVPLHEVNLDEVAFTSVRRGIQMLQNMQGRAGVANTH